MPKSPISKNKNQIFIVESHYEEESESYSDLVAAPDAEAAEKIVARVRDYATVTYTQSMADFQANAKRLSKLTVAKVEKDWKKLVEEHGE